MRTPTRSEAHKRAERVFSQPATNIPCTSQAESPPLMPAVSTIAENQMHTNTSPGSHSTASMRAPRMMAFPAYNVSQNAQADSYFTPRAPSSGTMQQPRPLSRRQSITLQSCSSYQMPLSLPGKISMASWTSPMRAAPQQQRTQPACQQASMGSELGWSLASAKSLPNAAQAGKGVPPDIRPLSLVDTLENSPSSAHSSRRRSMAHERYPPLASIFEAPLSARELQSEHSRAQLQLHSSVPATAYGALSMSGSTQQLSADQAAALPLGNSSQPLKYGRGMASVGNGISPLSPIKRAISGDSLASSFSIASSIASSSSAQSSYAYIFDSARPSAAATFHSNKRNLLLRQNSTSPCKRKSASSIIFDSLFLFSSTMPLDLNSRSTESSPLLGAQSSSAATLSSHEQNASSAALFAHEIKCIVEKSSYLFIGNVMQAAISMSQVASSGHLGRIELAAIGLAHMVVVLTGYPVAFSVLSCLETFASQSFTSAQPQLVGAYCIRALQIQWLLGLVLGAMWSSCGPLLAYIVRDTSMQVVSLAVTYLRWYLVPFMVFANMLCVKQVLYAQGITYPLPYLTLIGTVTTLSMQYVLTFAPWFEMGVRGIALGAGAGYVAMLVATLWTIRWHDDARIWNRQARAAPWRPFIRLLPSCLLLTLLSSGTSELITMAATQFGTLVISAQSVLAALSRMFTISVSGVSVAALNRTGNHIGQQYARGARLSTYAALFIGLLAVSLGAVAILWSPQAWAQVFTNDPVVVQEVVKVVPLVVVAFAAQALSLVGSQLLSAQGRQALAARIKFLALYMVGVPLGYYWTVMQSDGGLAGLWRAVAVGQACTAIVEAAVVLRTNWQKLCSDNIIYAAAV
ncbi:ethionine resistance protein [Coemansia brasiliensis]|uniref:Ethionine resistance protein n=1 Tax=Coemansia brasiliensis TaxID=2650707 RepID=A0A9W8IB35_9FUNG|nr:ethionine resistance protein [Coemansia brasiliensis]